MKKIVGSIKQYHWGKKANDCLILDLLRSNENIKYLEFDDNSPIAEYWLGTHKSGVFKILNESTSSPNYEIRFLLKLLCVNECLSLQIHPDKENAIRLHKEDPQHYPDENPKPEMVIAISKFRALCGFQNLSEIKSTIERCDYLKGLCSTVIGKDSIVTEQDLRKIINHILTLKSKVAVQAITKCLESLPDDHKCRKLIRELYVTYPDDAGLLLVCFLELHELDIGESLYIPANVPHAYLPGGDAVEVMVCSDNVIRAALTPKFKDISNLMKLMSISCVNKLTPISLDPGFTLYKLPCEEYFEVRSFYSKNPKWLPITIPFLDRHSILLVINGACRLSNGEVVNKGDSYLIESYESLQIEEYLQFPFHFFQAY